MTDILEQELQDSVLELTINRENAGNALSNEVIGLLNDSLMKHRSRSDLKCVLIKGSGEKFFVAKEGINGTIAGHREKIDPVAKELTKLFKLKKPNYKWSKSNCIPFRRLKVRLKNEIVTMGVTTVDPNKEVEELKIYLVFVIIY